MAKIALVATVEMAGLNECLDHITPEWLQSLILDQGSVSAVSGVAARVRDDPESCLDLLQVYKSEGWVPMCLLVEEYTHGKGYRFHTNPTLYAITYTAISAT